MEVPRLGAESELQLLACGTAMPDPSLVSNLQQSLWQRGILNLLSEAGDGIRILMMDSN